MNEKNNQRIWLLSEVVKLMAQDRSLLMANLAVCAGIFVLGYTGGQYKFAIGGMAIVQSINLPVLYETYLEAKTSQQLKFDHE